MQSLPKVPFNELARTLVGSVVAGTVLLLVSAILFSSSGGTQAPFDEDLADTSGLQAPDAQGDGSSGPTASSEANRAPSGDQGTGQGATDASDGRGAAAGAPGGGGNGGAGGQASGATGGPAGVVQGQVIDATTGRSIAGATVLVLGASISTKTDNTGSYRLSAAPIGEQTVAASYDGYITLEEKAKVDVGLVTPIVFTLSPKLKAGEIRIVLIWKDKPQDLDVHLWLPPANKYHVDHFSEHRGSPQFFPFAVLDVDATQGRGPETITINKLFEGEYIYAVNQFSSDAPIGGSEAVVRVYSGSSLLETFLAPAGEGRWWHVFTIDGSKGAIKPENKIVKENPEPYPF